MEFLSGPTSKQDNIWIASSDGDIARVAELLKDGQNVNGQDEYGYTPIHAATSYGHKALIEFLIQSGADINLRDLDGDTPLHICESPEIAEYLLAHGANEQALNNDGKSVYEQSVELENEDMIKFWAARFGLEVSFAEQNSDAMQTVPEGEWNEEAEGEHENA